MSLPRPSPDRPLPARPVSRRLYRALVVALAAFLAVQTVLREPFQGYQGEVAISGHASDDIDLPAVRRWLLASANGLAVQVVTSPIYPGDCELRLAKLGPQAAATRVELDEVARRFLEHYLPQQQAVRRQAHVQRIQLELQTARDREDALRSRVEELRGKQLTQWTRQREASPSESTRPIDSEQAALREQLAAKRRELTTLLASYTDEHPQVIAIRSLISRLEAQLAEAPAEQGPDLLPSARVIPRENQGAATRLVSTSSLLPFGPETDLAAELDQTVGDLAAATRERQWLDQELQTAFERHAARDVLLTWSAAPARIVGRMGGTPTPLSLLAAGMVAVLLSGLMFHAAGRWQAHSRIESAEQLASLLPVPLVGQAQLARRMNLLHLWRSLSRWSIPAGTLLAELLLFSLAIVGVLSVLGDPSLVPQLGVDPLGAWSEMVGRIVG